MGSYQVGVRAQRSCLLVAQHLLAAQLLDVPGVKVWLSSSQLMHTQGPDCAGCRPSTTASCSTQQLAERLAQ